MTITKLFDAYSASFGEPARDAKRCVYVVQEGDISFHLSSGPECAIDAAKLYIAHERKQLLEDRLASGVSVEIEVSK